MSFPVALPLPRSRIVRLAGATALVLVTAWIGVLAAVSELTAAHEQRPDQPLPWNGGAYLLALGAAGMVAVRVRRPLPAAAVVTALTWISRDVGYPSEAPGIALFVTCYAVAAHTTRRRWTAWAAAATAAAFLVPLLPPRPVSATSWAVLGPGIGLVTATLLGVSVRQRRTETQQRVRHAAERAEAEIERRLAGERLAIARELHDVLAHTISVISVQTGLALDVLDDDPQRARPALETVRASSREAIGQLRAAVRALRGDAPPLPEAPLTLAALDRVADG